MTMHDFDLIASPLLLGAFAVLVCSSGSTHCDLNISMRLRRTIRNLLLSLPAFLIARLALLPLPPLSRFSPSAIILDCSIGYTTQLAGRIVGILLLDYVTGGGTLAFIEFISLRFHNVHHTI